VALLGAAPSAHADTEPAAPVVVGVDTGALAVEPGLARPGGTVDLHSVADCGGTVRGTVRSAAFGAPVELSLAADGGLYGQALVSPSALPGPYAVVEYCQGTVVARGSLNVGELSAPDTGGGWAAARPGTGPLGYGAVGLTIASLLGAGVLAWRRWAHD
jgi:hypothetical protein